MSNTEDTSDERELYDLSVAYMDAVFMNDHKERERILAKMAEVYLRLEENV